MADTDEMSDQDLQALDAEMRAADASAEEEAAETAAPEASPEAPKPAVAPHPEDSPIPPARLKAEADRRRSVEQENAELRRRLEALAKPPKPEPKVPEFSEDPLGNLHERARRAEAELETVRHQREQQDLVQSLSTSYRAAAGEFARENPDFGDAYQHLIKARIGELVAIGVPPAQATQQMEMEELGLVQMALARGANPAEMVYTLAKHRGYATASAKPASREPEPERVLETLEAGKRAEAKGGTAPAGEGDIVRRLTDPSLSAKEFDELFERARSKGLLG